MKVNLKRSQEESFIKFLEDYKNLILKVAGIYCNNLEDRKDLIQEIIFQLWKSYPKYNDSYALSTWTYRIALNVSISHVRKTATRNKTINSYKRDIDFIHFQNPLIEEQLKILNKAIQFLKPLDKAIISLHMEGCKNQEISEVLGITITNVSTKLSRIKQQLKNQFSNTKTYQS